MLSNHLYVPSQRDLDVLLATWKAEKDYYSVGQALGMLRRTINENIQRFLEEGRTQVGKRGGGHPKWDDEMHQFLLKSVEEHPAVCSKISNTMQCFFINQHFLIGYPFRAQQTTSRSFW
jgi:transposase